MATKKPRNKLLSDTIEYLKSPTNIGILVTILFVLITINFYQIKSLNEYERHHANHFRLLMFEAIEWFDLKNMDGRFNIRGERQPSETVGLLAIDDRSLEEIGRWPWNRDQIAQMIEELVKYDVKAIGFDVIFSESQKATDNPDEVLAQTIEKYKDKIVLGVFNEETAHLDPYKDYCLNDAFKRANSEKFVKLNATFIVNDEADPFVDLDFSPIFHPIFKSIEENTTALALEETFQKASVEDLKQREKNRLNFMIESEVLNFCNLWLTSYDTTTGSLESAYKQVFDQSEHLKGLDLATAFEKFKSMTKTIPISQRPRWTINIDRLQEVADYTGSFNAEQDADGTIRSASLFFRTGNRIGSSYIPSLALQTYLLASGYRADVELNIDPNNPQQKSIQKFNIIDASREPEEIVSSIPVDEQGRMKINYSGGKNMFLYLPAKELFNEKDTAEVSFREYNPLNKRWELKTAIRPKSEVIKGRTFILGATAMGVYDLRVTPFDNNFPGPETHVNTLANLFEKNFIRTHSAESKVMPFAIALFGIILTLGIAHTTAIPGFLITFGSLGLIFVADQLIFRRGFITTMTLPAALVITLYVFLFFYKYLTEERKKKYLRSTFSKYVSPAIVDEILKDPENIELGGRKQRMSVMFSDVRGFTTISEKLDPQVLSDVLNRYLTPMTEIVFSNKGTLDKYMGDAVMAFFGAPIFFPDHAKHACRCALESLKKLKVLQDAFQKEGLPPIDIGIGINSAEMSVGNMGSEIVRSYTVMGDAVNLASRLEGINKEYGTRIVISEFTYNDVKDSFTSRELDLVKVKGKNEPVKIYELLCEGDPSPQLQSLLQPYNRGFKLFHEKKFHEALAAFNECLVINPQDPVSELYKERCEQYIQEPPPENWDGVFIMKTK